MILLLAVVVFPLLLVLLLWIFLPAITSHQNASKAKKKNTFSDHKGIIEADDQIHGYAKVDISLVVPAYNEVKHL
jgi:hypothetical protein